MCGNHGHCYSTALSAAGKNLHGKARHCFHTLDIVHCSHPTVNNYCAYECWCGTCGYMFDMEISYMMYIISCVEYMTSMCYPTKLICLIIIILCKSSKMEEILKVYSNSEKKSEPSSCISNTYQWQTFFPANERS